MEKCSRCQNFVDQGRAFCGTCGAARFVESLQAAPRYHRWISRAYRLTNLVILACFIMTFLVAFTREARGIRYGRDFLERARYENAWNNLEDFLKTHPNHEVGLYLGGKTTIRMSGHGEEAKNCLHRLRRIDPDLAASLAFDYERVLEVRSKYLGCDVEGFKNLLEIGEGLGPIYERRVFSGLDDVIRACTAPEPAPEELGTELEILRYKYQDDARQAALNTLVTEMQGPKKPEEEEEGEGDEEHYDQVASYDGHRGRQIELTFLGLMPAIESAAREYRFQTAQDLALHALDAHPAASDSVMELLADGQEKTVRTLEKVHQLCKEVRDDPQYQRSRGDCFPSVPPFITVAVWDSWGQPLTYSVERSRYSSSCHSGFKISSPGVDGVGEISCSYLWGHTSLEAPQFWLESPVDDYL